MSRDTFSLNGHSRWILKIYPLEYAVCSWNTLDVPGIRWMFLEYAVCSWNTLDVPGIRWMFLEYYGCSWNTMDVPVYSGGLWML